MTRRSVIAAGLSLLTPGFGHLYLGEPSRAVGLWLVSVAAGAASLLGVLHLPASALTAWLPVILPVGVLALVARDAFRRALVAPVPVPAPPAWYQRWYALTLMWLGIGVASQPLVKGVKQQFIEAFRVPSSSMEPAVLMGDFLYTDRRPAGRHDLPRGTIVVFQSVEEANLKQIKRIVALGGDTVAMREGQLLVNGVPAPESYLPPPAPLHSVGEDQRLGMLKWQELLLTERDSVSLHPDLNDWGPLVVPEQTLLLLGDNRQASYDSRYFGPVPVQNVQGQPSLIYYSYDPNAQMMAPWLTAARWSRVGKRPS